MYPKYYLFIYIAHIERERHKYKKKSWENFEDYEFFFDLVMFE